MATKAEIGKIAAKTFPGRESAAFACHTARQTCKDKINFLGKLLHMIHLPVIDVLGGTLPKDPCTPKQSSQYFLLMTAVTYHPICKNAPGKCLHIDIISCTFIYSYILQFTTQMLLLPVSPWA